MPALNELQRRYAASSRVKLQPENHDDEMLIVDTRGNLSPAQMVESKLRSALRRTALSRQDSVSHADRRRPFR